MFLHMRFRSPFAGRSGPREECANEKRKRFEPKREQTFDNNNHRGVRLALACHRVADTVQRTRGAANRPALTENDKVESLQRESICSPLQILIFA